MTSKLTQQKRSVMNEYAMQVAALMGFPKDFSWIADIHETSDLDVLEIGEGAYYLGWTDLQVIIDKLDVWIEKYGSREAVAERITAWNDWWLDEYSEHNGSSIVDIWESKKRRLTVEREMMMHYIDEFGGYIELRDLLYEIENQLDNASEEVEQLNEQSRKEFLNSEKGKKCIDTLTEAIENDKTKF